MKRSFIIACIVTIGVQLIQLGYIVGYRRGFVAAEQVAIDEPAPVPASGTIMDALEGK